MASDWDDRDTDLLAPSGDPGELRRLTILFADLVDSTVLSSRVEAETYHLLVGRYREQVVRIVDRYEGHLCSTKGDGLLVVFGHPRAHEDDVHRAVQAGLEITREVARLGEQARRRFGVDLNVRVGIHRGQVYLDTVQDDVYGLAANLAARVSAMAPPGAVVVSDAVEPLVVDAFELSARPPAAAKGVDGLIVHHQVIGERVAAPAGASRGPLMGRERELARIERSWERALASTLATPGMVFRAEAGIGKSRLVLWATELAAKSGVEAIELAGSALRTDAGLHPVRALLERRCGIERTTDPGERLRLLRSEAVSVGLDPEAELPLLAPVLGVGAEHGYEPVPAGGQRLYELVNEAVVRYLSACVGEGAGLLVAEDVHWFDASTMDILGAVLAARQGRLLVVVTARPSARLPANWPAKVVELKPLTDEETDALVAALDPTLSADVRSTVCDRCDGVPFYVEQVVAGLSGDGVPDGLYTSLFARLGAKPNVVPVLEAAAAIGRHVDRGLLGTLLDLADADIDDVLDELEDALVFEPWGLDSWRFRHELLREVAYELAPPSVARGLHGKIGDALVSGTDGDPDWSLVGGHYARAQRFDQAASAYQAASNDARRRGALAEAVGFLSTAIDGLENCPADGDRDRTEMALRLQRGFLATSVDGGASVMAGIDFRRCSELCGTDLSDDVVFATWTGLGAIYAGRADVHQTTRVVEFLRDGLPKERRWLLPAVDAALGVANWMRGDVDAADRNFSEAILGRAALEGHDLYATWTVPYDPIAVAHQHLALICLLRGDPVSAAAELSNSTMRADSLGFPQGPYSAIYAQSTEAWICIELGRLDRAAQLAAGVVAEAAQHGFDQLQLWGQTQQVSIAALSAMNADAPRDLLLPHVETLAALVDRWRAEEHKLNVTVFDAVLGRVLTAAGEIEEAGQRLDAGLRLGAESGMQFYDAELLRLRAHTRGDADARQADLEAAKTLARSQGATLFELRAALDDFELRGGPAQSDLALAASRMPPDSTCPELARAQAIIGELPEELGARG
jgi:class 3 adenylate cyclase